MTDLNLKKMKESPDFLYPDVFKAVQLNQIFKDQKYFVDLIPKYEAKVVNENYLSSYQNKDFNLEKFVFNNFDKPKPYITPDLNKNNNLIEHINSLWNLLKREDNNEQSSLLNLPYPYVVPGGRFLELYYWDSYFTMIGLIESNQFELFKNMLDNFAYLIRTFGHIPNGTRDYYLSRSQPPFFSLMLELENENNNNSLAVYSKYLNELLIEYNFWMNGIDNLNKLTEINSNNQAIKRVVKLKDGAIFNRYCDDLDTPRPESYLYDIETAKLNPNKTANEIYKELRSGAESGWDFSSRWLEDKINLNTIRTTKVIPIDLNCLIYHLEKTISLAYKYNKDNKNFEKFNNLANNRKTLINKYLFNDKLGFYTDYDWQKETISEQLTAASSFALFLNITDKEKANKTAKNIEKYLLSNGGLLTTNLNTNQQWDYPNVWAPLQWTAIKGLLNYGEFNLAKKISKNFLNQVNKVFNSEHRLVEKYDAKNSQIGTGGEYLVQDGFGWTNGVVLKLLNLKF